MDACKKGHYDTVMTLVERMDPSPCIGVKGSVGDSTIHWEANNGHRDITKLLLDKGANVNARTNCGVTPLHLACYHGGNKDTIKLLLNRGAKIDAKDDDGYSPIHYAGSKEDVVMLLLERGAEKDVLVEEMLHGDEESVVAVGSVNVSKIYQSRSRVHDHDVSANESNPPTGSKRVTGDAEKLTGEHEERDWSRRRGFHDDSDSSSSSDPDEGGTIKLFDVFLSHCWGDDEEGRDNHERVATFHEALKSRGIRSWFDSEHMDGNFIENMAEGIDNSGAVVVFITRNYIKKVSGHGKRGKNDKCKMEFEYSSRRKGSEKMKCVVMEKVCRERRKWNGPVGMVLGGHSYYSFEKDDQLDSCIDSLVEKIQNIENILSVRHTSEDILRD